VAAADMLAVNVTSTLRLLDYARQVGAQQFIYASSGGLYGSGPGPFAETDAILPCDQLNFYLTTKFCAEVLVKKYAPFFTTIILRPFFIYGRDQASHMLMPRLISNVWEGIPIRLAGPNGICLNPIYNLDFVEVLERCLTLQESHTINVAGSESLPMRQIGETIGDILGKAAHFIIEADEEGHLLGDTSKLERLLGYRPCVSFREGVSHVLKAYTS
jgi:nucleoside-diphosphate-sugar epimerase